MPRPNYSTLQKVAQDAFFDEFLDLCKQASLSRAQVEAIMQIDPFMKVALIDQAAMNNEIQVPQLSKLEFAAGAHVADPRRGMPNADYHTAMNRAAVANMFSGSTPAELASGRNAMPVKGMLADKPTVAPARKPPPLPANAVGSVATQAARAAMPAPVPAATAGPRLQLAPRPYVPTHATAPHLALR
jgi:hypothetical protein